MFCVRTKLAFNAPKDGRGIGQKQVLEQNLSSTDVHGRTSVERYTDVQQLKMVQMVSQSQFFRDFSLFCLMRLPFSRKNVRNFKSTTPTQRIGAQCSTFRTVYSIRWLQSALIPFVTTQSVGGLNPRTNKIFLITHIHLCLSVL